MRNTVLIIKEGCLSKEAEKKLTEIRKSGVHIGNLIDRLLLNYEIVKN